MPYDTTSGDGYPDDWFVPSPSTASSATQPAPSPRPNTLGLGFANPPTPPLDPFAAYWDTIPASRLAAVAWAPPIFPDAFGRFLLTPPVPAPLAAPLTITGGLFDGIGRMLAEQARANDPWQVAANSLLGGIPKMLAASASPGSGAFLGTLANLQPAGSSAPAQASYLPNPRPFLSPDPIGYQGGSPLQAYLRNDLLNRADPTGSGRPPTEEAFGAASDTSEGNATPNVLLIGGGGEEKPHDKLDPAVAAGLTDIGLTTSPTALPTLPPLLPPRLLAPTTSAPQPPPRASLPSPSAAPPGALSPPSPGQAANSPRPAGTPIRPTPAGQSEGDAGDRAGGSGDSTGSPYGEPNGSVEPNITKPYSRPPNATTRQQRVSVQGQPCVNCGVVHPRMHANHIEPLVQQYYRTGTIDTAQMQSPNAVNAQCPTCSARQGGFMANFSKFMKDLLGF